MNEKQQIELIAMITNNDLSALQQRAREDMDVMVAVLNGLNQEAIHIAAITDGLQIIEFILSCHPLRINATDAMNQTPLMIAVSHGHFRTAQYLIQQNARLDIARYEPSAPYHGLTALVLATELGHHAIVDLLIDAGALDFVKSEHDALDLLEQNPSRAQVFLKNATIMHLLCKSERHASAQDAPQYYYKTAGRRPSFCADIEWGAEKITLFKSKERIGQGQFGTVRAFVSSQGQSRAIKSLSFTVVSEERANHVFQEIRQESVLMQKAYDAPSFCRSYFFKLNEGPRARGFARIVMPLVEGKCADIFLKEIQCEHVFAQIISFMVQAIIALHQKEIVHGDIKPDNMLISFHNGKYHVTLVDFGFSEHLTTRQSDKVTYDEWARHWAPERIIKHASQPYETPAPQTNQDVFSFGYMLGNITKPYQKKLARSYPSIARFIQAASNPIPSERPTLTSFCTELVIEIGEYFIEYDHQLALTGPVKR